MQGLGDRQFLLVKERQRDMHVFGRHQAPRPQIRLEPFQSVPHRVRQGYGNE